MNQNEVDKTEEISNESEALSIDEDVKLIEEASDAVEAKQKIQKMMISTGMHY